MIPKALRLRHLVLHPWLAYLTAFLGGFAYLAQALLYAHTILSETDEGAYLYQGYLLATGVYHPYQANGPWFYTTPLSYLILGRIQAWFGPGLRTGRYFAIFVSMLMLLGIWIAARRLGGKWWAAAAVWVIALNPAQIKIYTLAESQVLVACMLAWVLALVLGEERSLWQVAASSFLAGLILLTRHNMAPILPIVLVYIFWQHGKKFGLWALLFGLLPVVVVHCIYWPDILAIWAPWLPAKLTPFLNSFRPPQDGSATLKPLSNVLRLLAFAQGFRFNFLAMVGSLAFLILWQRPSRWKNLANARASLFLASLFFTLLAFHGWATLFNNFCVFCFAPYTMNFSMTVPLLVISSREVWVKQVSKLNQLILLLVLLLLSAGIGYTSSLRYDSEDLGAWLLNIRVPRLKDFFTTWRFLPGDVELWRVIANKFGLEYAASHWLVPTIAGFIVGLVLLAISIVIWHAYARKRGFAVMSFSMLIFLFAGTILSPTPVLGGGYTKYDCQGDIIHAYEQTGHYLAELLPPGSKVYWEGGTSIVPLLYTPGIRILPGQIYGFWSFSPDKDVERVLKYGLWNEGIANQWRNEADFILVEANRYDVKWDEFFLSGHQFEELKPSPQPIPCIYGTYLRVFQRRP
jgi:hypothetical protein